MVKFFLFCGLFCCWLLGGEIKAQSAAPDYSQAKYWAALPDRADAADVVPKGETDGQAQANADVFFIHPTTLIRSSSNEANARLDDEALNKETDETTIRLQASVFNGSGKVYAPRYRQAHLRAFYANDSTGNRRALDLAYEDVKAAFTYYLEHYNHSRPLIIAAHSQGSRHAVRLLQEFFDGKPLQKRLVAAYLPGMPVRTSDFRSIKPCTNSRQCNCFTSWNTFGWERQTSDYYAGSLCTNPLNWLIDETYAPDSLNKGGVLRDLKVRPRMCDAKVNDGILWIHTPRLGILKPLAAGRRNFHIGDYNLFYINVRQNVAKRIDTYIRVGVN